MSKFYMCSCGSEVIHIESFDASALSEKAASYEIEFAIFYYKYANKYSFWQRFRYCWRVLRTGKPYPDQICLHADEARRLGKDLVSMTAAKD